MKDTQLRITIGGIVFKSERVEWTRELELLANSLRDSEFVSTYEMERDPWIDKVECETCKIKFSDTEAAE